MSGECDICGVMGCVESNHKEPPMASEQTPEKIAAELMDRYAMIDEADHMLRDDIADAIRAARASGAAARDGEVGSKIRKALSGLVGHVMTGMVTDDEASEYWADAIAALAPGNGGEVKP